MAAPPAARAMLLAIALAATPAVAAGPDVAAADAGLTDQVIVTATRFPEASLDVAGNTGVIDQAEIELINPVHVNELGVRIPGVWLSRGSGQESLTAIRSPVLTGPGSCGSYLFLEDGMSIRPTGFCNVNELFEVDAEQARRVEVIRGPANALYGSNGVHGTINVLMPEPGGAEGYALSGEAGPNDFARGEALWNSGSGGGPFGDDAFVAGILADHDDGFRDASGYHQEKGFAAWDRDLGTGRLGLGFTATHLDQQTAGFIVGKDSYKDEAIRLTNPNPESYRKADSQRLSGHWQPADGEDGVSVYAILRHSDMDFMQHFLPGEPIEKNGQTSGAVTVLREMPAGPATLTAGLDVEYADGWLQENQTQPEVPGLYPRPTGLHYDYDVREYLAGPYAQARWETGGPWTLTGGLRYEYLRYDYDNHLPAGNTRDDGTTCGGNGCLFNRPADRHDDFHNLAPNAGVVYRIGPESSAYLSWTQGFRAPQAAELYRLQATQNVTDLKSENIDSLELGWRWQSPALHAELAAYTMHKHHYIFQDSNRYNVSDGKSDHYGVEVDLEARSELGFYGALAATWCRQTYAFDDQIAGGETITSGNDIDTAPRTFGSLRTGYANHGWQAEAEWLHQGGYYLTAENTSRYPGHDLFNARAAWTFRPGWTTTVRVNNLLDTDYADRADYAFGNYRYFPGRGREAYVELAYRNF